MHGSKRDKAALHTAVLIASGAGAMLALSIGASAHASARPGTTAPPASSANQAPAAAAGGSQAEHPLAAALRMAEAVQKHIDEGIHDYTATLVKRERIGGKLAEPQAMFTKIRHEQIDGDNVVVPFSVYMHFVSPTRIKGREVIYVAGRNNNQLLVQESPHTLTGALLNTKPIDPNGMLAMRGNRYPITQVGIKTLMRRLMEVAREDMKHGECKVKFFKGARVDGRICRCVQVVHPVRREHFRFHVVRIFFDDDLKLPVHYASYDWPERPGEEPPLTEEYSYLKLKLNVGLTDRDFDPSNPEYQFK